MGRQESNKNMEDRNMGRQITVLLVFSCLSFSCCLTAYPNDTEKALREKWAGVYGEIARSIEMRRGSTQLTLADKPLLFYTNPVRATDQHGTIFLWTDRGRPAVLGSVWSALNRPNPSLRNITHEWHSLVEEPDVQAARDGQAVWTSGEPGIAWRALAMAPAPASSGPARLRQMREIARGLTASITAEEPTELRLMPQPLYRYPEKTPHVTDGALFVYALATDPELILLVEAGDKDAAAYRVAFARFGNLAMAVKEGDRTLWSCDRGTPGRSDGKYYLHWRVEQRAADLGEK